MWKRRRPLSPRAAPPVGPVDSAPAGPACSAGPPALLPPSHSRPPESAAGSFTLKTQQEVKSHSRAVWNAPWRDRRRDPETRRLAGFLPRLPGKSGASPDRRHNPRAASRPDCCRRGEEEVQTVPRVGGFRVSGRRAPVAAAAKQNKGSEKFERNKNRAVK